MNQEMTFVQRILWMTQAGLTIKQVSLDEQSVINTHLMHEPLPTDARIYMTVGKVINHFIKPLEALQEPLRPPLKASNG